MCRRDIIADDLLTGSILTLGLFLSSTCGFGELKLHINTATGLTCPVVKSKEICLLHSAKKLFCGVNWLGLVSSGSNQDPPAREARLEINSNWRGVVLEDEKYRGSGEVGKFRGALSFSAGFSCGRDSLKNSSTDVSLFNLTLHSSCSRFNAKYRFAVR